MEIRTPSAFNFGLSGSELVQRTSFSTFQTQLFAVFFTMRLFSLPVNGKQVTGEGDRRSGL